MNHLKQVTLRVTDGIACISLNRPSVRNAFTGLMGKELSDAYRRCDNDNNIKVVILTGEGSAFCAGADLSQGEDTFSPKSMDGYTSQPLSFPAWLVRKPVIGAINGHALGWGLSLALQTDIRFLAREGSYGFLQTRRGVLADGGLHWLLPRLIGHEKALDMLLTGRKLNGDEAVSTGIGLRCVNAVDVLDAAYAYAKELVSECSILSVGMAKGLVWNSGAQTLDQAIDDETTALLHAMYHNDAREGGLAWMERRAPNWSSQVPSDWPLMEQKGWKTVTRIPSLVSNG